MWASWQTQGRFRQCVFWLVQNSLARVMDPVGRCRVSLDNVSSDWFKFFGSSDGSSWQTKGRLRQCVFWLVQIIWLKWRWPPLVRRRTRTTFMWRGGQRCLLRAWQQSEDWLCGWLNGSESCELYALARVCGNDCWPCDFGFLVGQHDTVTGSCNMVKTLQNRL